MKLSQLYLTSFLLELSQKWVCSSLLTNIPHCTVKYFVFFAVFLAVRVSLKKPNHVILWKLVVQREVTYCVDPHHIPHRLWYQNGHRLCHSGMSLMGLQIFQVNCNKVFVSFHLCTIIPHFCNSC